MVAEWLLVLSLLAPVGADPAPSSLPLEYPTTWEYRGADGKLYRFTGRTTGTLTIEEPPPPPVGPTITALKNEQGQGVESIRSGEVLVIEGVKLWQEGVQLRVQIPGRTAAVLSTSPTRLAIRFSAIAEPVTGPLQIYHNTGSGWTLIATGPRITVNPPAPPGRLRPRIRSFHGLDGEIKQVFARGEPVLIRGENFGEGGVVEIGWEPQRVLHWSDSEIVVGTETVPAWGWFIGLTRSGAREVFWFTGPQIKGEP